MSNLTSLNINQSFQGLINLSDSTTGITSTPQQLQDGLGNDTGIKIATNRLEGGNIYNVYRAGIAQYYGTGFFQNTPSTPTNAGNILSNQVFYDNGLYSYSAISIYCHTLAAGESVDIAFYNAQYLETYGYVPYQKLVAEVNIPLTSTGIKTASFATPLTFSATGAGVYWIVCKFNGAATPVARTTPIPSGIRQFCDTLTNSMNGIVYNVAGTIPAFFAQNTTTATNPQTWQYNTGTFPTTWTSTELNLLSSTLGASYNPGFILHTIR